MKIPANGFTHAGKFHADDTPVQVLLPGNKKPKTGLLWTYVRRKGNG